MKIITDKPDLYDLLYNDVTEDIAMYIELLKNYKTILEFGCGTGRITLPLATNNHYIEAVELSAQMLNKLKSKINNDKKLVNHINPILANMCNYKSTQKFDSIIIPLTSFNYLLTEGEQRECINSIEYNLKDNGWTYVKF